MTQQISPPTGSELSWAQHGLPAFLVSFVALLVVLGVSAMVVGLFRGWFRRPEVTFSPAAEEQLGVALGHNAGLELVSSSRRLTPARHAGMLEHLQQIKRDLDMVSDATKAPNAVGDAAMLYAVVSWLAPITEELLCEHVKISPAMTLEEEAPKKRLNERYRKMAAGAFGMAKPDGERPL